jgi:hypothetical protein
MAAQENADGNLLLTFQRTNAYMEMESAAPHARGLGGMVSQHSTLHYPTINTCLAVYDSGAYTIERIDERSGKPKIKVAKGTLTPAELQQLQSILNEQSFRSISPGMPGDPPEDAVRLKEGELVATKVMRAEGPQQMIFLKRRYATSGSSGLDKFTSNWEKFDKPMKPFLSWEKDVEKKGLSAANDTQTASCVSPEGAF